MHRHNFELIAEYAQGSLDDDARARALVESCDRCRATYDEQVSALAVLSSATTASLSEHEKAALHRDVWTELRSPAPAAEKEAFGWWRSSWAIGATAVVVIGVGLIGVLNSQDSVIQTFSEVGSGLGGSSTNGLTGEDALAPEENPPTLEGSRVLDMAGYKSITNEVRSADGTTTAYASAALPTEGTGEEECLETAGLDDYLVLDNFGALTSLIVAVPQEETLSETPIVFVDPDSCTIVHSEE